MMWNSNAKSTYNKIYFILVKIKKYVLFRCKSDKDYDKEIAQYFLFPIIIQNSKVLKG